MVANEEAHAAKIAKEQAGKQLRMNPQPPRIESRTKSKTKENKSANANMP
jgi:hypothetical protein